MNYKKILGIIRKTKPLFENKKLVNEKIQKGPFDYVTQVDLSVQEYLKSELRTLYPDIAMLSEEQEINEFNHKQSYWILDPVDGTTNLMHQYGQFAVSLALYQNGDYTFGAIYNPTNGQMFWAVKGKGAFLGNQQIFASTCNSISTSLIAVGISPYNKQNFKNCFSAVSDIYYDCQDMRRCGSAALEIAYVAAGWQEAYFDQLLQPWDIAAGIVILREAKGMATTFKGDELPVGIKTNIVVSNGHLHGYLTDKLAVL